MLPFKSKTFIPVFGSIPRKAVKIVCFFGRPTHFAAVLIFPLTPHRRPQNQQIYADKSPNKPKKQKIRISMFVKCCISRRQNFYSRFLAESPDKPSKLFAFLGVSFFLWRFQLLHSQLATGRRINKYMLTNP